MKNLQPTIIVPVLNNVTGLNNNFDSILSQPCSTPEFIVIDGGSTDGSLEVIESYKGHINYWETGLDSGIADAFNRGIAHATGDIIGILNSDDILEPKALSHLMSAIEQMPTADIYYGSIRYYDPQHQSSTIRRPNLSNIHKRMSIFHPALFIRRSCYEKVGNYNCRYTHAMDSEWCHRAIAAGMKFHEVPAVLATMSLGGVSDIEYKQSLKQYRNSVIHHKLTNHLTAYFYYYFYLTVKTVMRFSFMRPIKLLRDRFLEFRSKTTSS